jgi:hypothetical protein
MADDNTRINRNQLSQFIEEYETIKQFENLFKLAKEVNKEVETLDNQVTVLEGKVETLEGQVSDLEDATTPETIIIADDIGFLNSWVEFDSRYRPKITVVGAIAYMSGLVKSGTSNIILILPANLRPTTYQNTSIPTAVSGGERIYINDIGHVIVLNYSATWTCINISWVIGQ